MQIGSKSNCFCAISVHRKFKSEKQRRVEDIIGSLDTIAD